MSRALLGKLRPAAIFCSMFLAGGVSVAHAAPPAGAPGLDERSARIVEHWTAERRASAIPRDLVIDRRGLGYLRRPDGTFEPYGHEVAAEVRTGGKTPMGKPVGGDTTRPVIGATDPASGATLGASYTFAATVTDADSGVRSVTFTVQKDGSLSQTSAASNVSGDRWEAALSGFTDGSWSYFVTAKDNGAKGGNTATSGSVNFSVYTGGGGGGGGGTVTNAQWTGGGTVQTAAGRLYFEMPANKRRRNWAGYVCSGTVATDGTTGRSIILTAAHCVYDDANKAFARNVMFIPDQAGTIGSRTDLDCGNDPLGCWVPALGVVDANWTTRTFPANIPWDYANYVVSDTDAHQGSPANPSLDVAAGSLSIQFGAPTDGSFTHALGYSYSEDPKFMYCAENLTTESSYNDWWLGSCGLSGGSSGGPWMQPVSGGNGPIISVNSWGYTNSPGMAGPKLSGTSASCVFGKAKSASLPGPSTVDGDAGVAVTCP